VAAGGAAARQKVIYLSPVPKPSISAFFPCYNDAPTIGNLVVQAERELRALTDDYEIIVVNDGSRDESASVLAALSKEVERLRVVTHPTNRGYGAALRSGFEQATKDLVFYTDGDGQYDVREMSILMMLLTDDTHFVNGMKMTRQDPPHRVFFGNLHRFVTRWSFWLPINDVDCDFRLVRRSILQKLRLSSSSGSICVELVKQAQRAGAQFREVSVHHYARRSGVSEFFTPRRILHTYADLAVMWVELMIVAKLKGLRALIESAA
jgi:glycosyltransferase involved in cell wall biosynthesis